MLAINGDTFVCKLETLVLQTGKGGNWQTDLCAVKTVIQSINQSIHHLQFTWFGNFLKLAIIRYIL